MDTQLQMQPEKYEESRADSDDGALHDVHRRFETFVAALWWCALIFGTSYLVVVYLIPLATDTHVPVIPGRRMVELLICGCLSSAAAMRTVIHLLVDRPVVSVDGEFLFVEVGNKVFGSICFQLGALQIEELTAEEQPTYDTSMLLAIRMGMDNRTSVTYEAGVAEGSPFLRIVVTLVGESEAELRDGLQREATRLEAIMLTMFDGAQVAMLAGEALQRAVVSSCSSEAAGDRGLMELGHCKEKGIIIRGIPMAKMTRGNSQVGRFLTTLLKQGWSASLSCTITKAAPSKERKHLESEWRSIRDKERRSQDSLADQALKKRLISEYATLANEAVWFDTTTIVLVRNDDPLVLDAMRGLVLSIWGGSGTIEVRDMKASTRTQLRRVTRRHIQPTRLPAEKVVAYFSPPTQQLPIVTSARVPTFPIPPADAIDNQLVIGHCLFRGRRLRTVGLQPEWLTEHVLVLGATGTGKTTMVKTLMVELSKKTDVPWWIFDVKGSEYSDLSTYGVDDVTVLTPGFDPSVVLDVLRAEDGEEEEQHAYALFRIIRELLHERSESTELTPAMERLLADAVLEAVQSDEGSIRGLQMIVERVAEASGVGVLTRDALVNRLRVLTREPLGSILKGGEDAIRISELMGRRVVFDLRYVSMVGGMDAARILYNLVAKRIFDHGMRRGLARGLQHVVVLEEASNLVPESYVRQDAADVSTGESMVLLQRATGQGVIVVSTRPNVSSNILANAATRIMFRLPYDSAVGARYMSLDSEQERYLRVMPRGHALVAIPSTETFEIETEPLKSVDRAVPSHATDSPEIEDSVTPLNQDAETAEVRGTTIATDTLFDEVVRSVTARLSVKPGIVHSALCSLIEGIIPSARTDEVVDELLAIGLLEREAIAIAAGGFVYALAGKVREAVAGVIMEYIAEAVKSRGGTVKRLDNRKLIVNRQLVMVVPEHIERRTMDEIVDRIAHTRSGHENEVENIVVVVRGSVAATMIRELLDGEEYDAVTIVSAFASSLDAVVDEALAHDAPSKEEQDHGEMAMTMSGAGDAQVATDMPSTDCGSRAGEQSLMCPIAEWRPRPMSRATEQKIWVQLLHDFVESADGRVEWDDLVQFIDTTAAQSAKGRVTSLDIEEGRQALVEMLADETLVAVRIQDVALEVLDEGLWIVTPKVLGEVKHEVIVRLEERLRRAYGNVRKGHENYDICAGQTSVVVFPSQERLKTLAQTGADAVCRECSTNRIVCILSAEEYLDSGMMLPDYLRVATVWEAISASSLLWE